MDFQSYSKAKVTKTKGRLNKHEEIFEVRENCCSVYANEVDKSIAEEYVSLNDNAEYNSLINNLKQMCNGDGKEIDFLESAIIFHELSKIIRKCKHNRMRNLIKTVALLNVAIARQPTNVQEIKEDLNQVCSDILCEAGAVANDIDLIKISDTVKELITSMRHRMQTILNSGLPQPDEGLHHYFLPKQFELAKIDTIQKLQLSISEDFKNYMALVSIYCEHIMGPPPCLFALAGMDSLARKEVTPYSDFEHIILLEEGDYDEIALNYFRWFSVIFQIILINLQETILPSVTIFGLNDESSKHGNWFFDSYTKRGISFDGMMPHASKFPLGREETENKPWKTELIQPVSKMLQYLKSETSFKNGYHLSDILTKTCLVYGNEKVFDAFKNGVDKEIYNQSENTVEEIKKQISDDLNSFATRTMLLQIKSKKSFNMKRVFYRSTTIFLAALGRLYKINGKSCFEIINGLCEKEIFSKNACHKLKFAVALACEVRLKWYMKSGKQSDNMPSIAALTDLIGMKSIVSYFQIAYALQFHLCQVLSLKNSHFYSKPKLLNLAISCALESTFQTRLLVINTDDFKLDRNTSSAFDDCLSYLEKDFGWSVNNNPNNVDPNADIENHLVFLGEIFCIKKQYNDAMELFLEAERRTKILPSTFSLNAKEELLSQISYNVGYCLSRQSKYSEALEYFGKCRSVFVLPAISDNSDVRKVAKKMFQKGFCLKQVGKYSEAKQILEESLFAHKNCSLDIETDKNVAECHLELGKCFFFIGKFDIAIHNLRSSLQIINNRSNFTNVNADKATAMTLLGRCFNKKENFEEALFYLNEVLQITRTFDNIQADKVEKIKEEIAVKEAALLFEIGECLRVQGEYKTAICRLEESLAITENLLSSQNLEVSNTRYSIGRCLLALQQFSESMVYFEKALHVNRKQKQDDQTKRILSEILHDMACCSTHFLKFEQAIAYSNEALDLQRNSADNTRSNHIISLILLNMANCYIKTKSTEKATECVRDALEIRQTISQNFEGDVYIAKILDVIGELLILQDDLAKQFNDCEAIEKLLFIENKYDINTLLDCAKTYLIYYSHLANKKRKSNVTITHSKMNTIPQMNIIDMLINIGRHLRKHNLVFSAIIHLKNAMLLQEEVTHNLKNGKKISKIMYFLGRCYIDINKYEDAITYFKKSIKIQEKMKLSNSDNDDSLLRKTLNFIGISLIKVHQYAEAVNYFDKWLKNFDYLSNQNSLFNVILDISYCFLYLHDFSNAAKHMEKAIQLNDNVSLDNDTLQRSIEILHELGRELLKQMKIAAALKFLEYANDKILSIPAFSDWTKLCIFQDKGRCFISSGNFSEALKHFMIAYDLYKQINPVNCTDNKTTLLMHEIALCLLHKNQIDDALKYLHEAKDILLIPTMHFDQTFPNILQQIGKILMDVYQQYQMAMMYFEKALKFSNTFVPLFKILNMCRLLHCDLKIYVALEKSSSKNLLNMQSTKSRVNSVKTLVEDDKFTGFRWFEQEIISNLIDMYEGFCEYLSNLSKELEQKMNINDPLENDIFSISEKKTNDNLKHFVELLKKQLTFSSNSCCNISRLTHCIGRCLLEAELLEKAEISLQFALELESLNTSNDSALSFMAWEVDNYFMSKNKITKKACCTQNDLKLFSSTIDNFRFYANIHYDLGRYFKLKKSFQKALEHVKKGLLLNSLLPPRYQTDEDIAELLNLTAECLCNAETTSLTLICLEKLSDFLPLTATKNLEEKLIEVLYNIGNSAKNSGMCVMAANHFSQALQICRKHRKTEQNGELFDTVSRLNIIPMQDLKIIMNLAKSYFEMNQASKALDCFTQAICIVEKVSKETESSLEFANEVHLYRTRCLIRLDRTNEANACIEEILKKTASLTDNNVNLIALTLHDYGHTLIKKRMFSTALPVLQKGFHFLESFLNYNFVEINHSNLVDVMHDLVICLTDIGKLCEAKNYIYQSLLFQKNSNQNDFNDDNKLKKTSFCLYTLAICLIQEGNYNEALFKLDESLQLQKKTIYDSEAKIQIASSYYQYGFCLRLTCQATTALQYLQTALIMKQELYRDDFDIVGVIYEISMCFLDLEKYDDANFYLLKALKIKEKLSLDFMKNKEVCGILYNIGECLPHTRKPLKVVKFLKNILFNKDNTIPADPKKLIGYVVHLIGSHLQSNGMFAKAIKQFQIEYDLITEKANNPNCDERFVDVCYRIGVSFNNLKQFTDALFYLNKALTMQELVCFSGSTNSTILDILLQICISLNEMNKFNESLPQMERLLEVYESKKFEINDEIACLIFLEMCCCMLGCKKFLIALDYFNKALLLPFVDDTEERFYCIFLKFWHNFTHEEESNCNDFYTKVLSWQIHLSKEFFSFKLKAIILHSIGSYFIETSNFSDAFRVLKNAKKIMQNQHFESYTNLQLLEQQLNLCCLKLNQFDDAKLSLLTLKLNIKKQFDEMNLDRRVLYVIINIGHTLVIGFQEYNIGRKYLEYAIEAFKIKGKAIICYLKTIFFLCYFMT